ncbi:hypothetical protein ABB37_00919 [Leptomonas pyrrhocoris]|uniref:BRCT domain-containing protein n=1 Tax=Leptomonas pyrrhocoris TaxID=157538 RepID=A0A0N0VI56_LEPPY|nr:hypothetical protein ABB37_00919 [Leptomonas pyrrhocoris]KPA86874.1 hypothetical protein ABB37_00919 [Leptomonas pyrrhocoris]|eukprot:XP_015665313.1 hypothetical protein ABB37_00919 [Leptomonas pyrrhocoris]
MDPRNLPRPPLTVPRNSLSTSANRVLTSSCCVAFTGFREDDEWHDAHENDGVGLHANPDVGAGRSELDVYDRLAQEAGVVTQPTFMSTTSVLVARRGFTKKRLLAAHRRVPVVLPSWVEDGCPLASWAPPESPSSPADPNTAHSITPVDASYAVPWLHGYVFSTTGLSTQEKTAIEEVCVERHGAVMEAALTYRCDALLVSAECIRELQELLRRDALSSDTDRAKQQLRQGRLRARAESEAAARNYQNSEANPGSVRGDGSWLTDKMRFALEFDIPVVDYVKLFSLLRLDRLPSPTVGLTSSPASATTSRTSPKEAKKSKRETAVAAGSASAAVAWLREAEEEALNGNDFDAVVGICRVPAPVGGAAQWRRLLEATAPPLSESSDERGRGDGDGDAACGEDAPVCADVHDSPSSNSSDASSSASTVSDPDAWEDFMQHVLVPGWNGGDATNPPQPQQRIEAYPVGGPTHNSAPQPADLALNTDDVDVHLASVEPAALYASAADYYSETGVRSDVTQLIGVDACLNDANASWETKTGSDTTITATLGASQVDPSPRLTTNALLQRDAPPRSSDAHATSTADELSNDDPLGGDFGACVAAYYEARRREQPSSHRMPVSAAPWRVPSPPSPSTAGADAENVSDTLPMTTEVLVESCVSADPRQTPSVASAPPPAEQPASSNALARFTLPLFVMHPPYLTVSLLGCTAAEVRQARVWCGICRFLRSPVPTVETDVVVLGGNVLLRKKYVVPSTHTTRGGTRNGGGVRAAAAAAMLNAAKMTSHGGAKRRQRGQRGTNGEDEDAVCIRYWELDMMLARALVDTCGIALSRMAPLRWLEDAAAASQKAAAAAAAAGPTHGMSSADETANTADDDTVSLTNRDRAEMETTTTPQETLADLVEERLEAVRREQEEQQQRLLAAESAEAEVDADSDSAFHPFPALLPEQLPSLASPRYYIRLRRPISTSMAATAEGGVDAKPVKPSLTRTKHHTITVEADSANTNVEAQQNLFLQKQQQQSGLVASPSSTGSSFSPVRATLSKTKTDTVASFDTTHMSFSGTDSKHNSSSPLLMGSNAELVGSASPPASPASSANAPISEHSYDDDLANAGRRFRHLIELFVVNGDAAIGEATRSGSAAGQGGGNCDAACSRRRHALQSCCFCCVDGEYARVDWAVLRGLVRYGGGRVEKKTAEEWEKLLTKPKDRKQAPLPAQSSLSHAGSSRDGNPDDAVDQRRLAARVRRSVELDKQQRKLTRLLLRMEINNTDSKGNTELSSSHAGSPNVVLEDARDTASTNARHSVATDTVVQLKRKLVNAARACQQSPTFCLLPHSFQRAPATLATERGAAATRAPLGSRLHALRGLASVTQDHILACLAVGHCLDPRSCFLFYTSIPSAPDVRLFHARTPQPSPQQFSTPNGAAKGLCSAAAESLPPPPSPPPSKPLLSTWTREKRYCKPESVGVCVTFLWRLPSSDTPWVSAVDTSEATRPRPPPAVQLDSSASAHDAEGYSFVPSAQLVPLIRVLLLGFRNAVEAMGGHVADAFSSASATHVVVVDVASILSSSLEDMYTAAVTGPRDTPASTPSLPTAASEQEGGEGADTSHCYWPADAVPAMVRSAARQEVSLVRLDWLASCVKWGSFIDEAAFTPPSDLQACVVACQQQVHKPKQQQRPHASQLPSRKRIKHATDQQKPLLTSQSIRDGSAARAAVARKRIRTSSPAPSSASLRTETATASDAGQVTAAAPHTPPRPWPAAKKHMDEGQPRPSLSFLSAPPTDLHDGNNRSRAVGEGDTDSGVHTPVMRRLPPSPSASNSNSIVEPCTPPPRPPVPMNRLSKKHPYVLHIDSKQSSPVPPSARSGSHSLPPPSAVSRRSVSGSTHRQRASPSASQHNTYSLAEQQDAEAYVTHLGTMFNFCSPGSTPLPSSSSARRGRQLSMSAVQQADYTPLPESFRDHVLHQMLDHPASSPQNNTQQESTSAEAPLEVLTPPLTTQMSGVLSTPRRRTLRAVAAAAAAASSTVPRGSLGSPDRRRHRADGLSSSDSAACPFNESQTTDDQYQSHRIEGIVAAAVPALPSSNVKSKKGSTPVDNTRVVPMLLGGGGSTLLSRGGTELNGHALPDCASNSDNVSCEKAASPGPMSHEGASTAVTVSLRNAGNTNQTEEEDRGVWVARTPSSPLSSSVAAAAEEEQPLASSDSTQRQDVLCRFTGEAPPSEDETTVPLPCTVEAAAPLTEVQQTAPCFSFLDDVVPDSQSCGREAGDGRDGVLVPVSFITATDGAYAAYADALTAEGQRTTEEAKQSKVRHSLELVDGAPPMVLAAESEEDGHDRAELEGRDTAAFLHVERGASLHADELGSRGGRPRLGTCSVPRQLSPSPAPPVVRQTEDAVVDVDDDSNEEEEEHDLNDKAVDRMRSNRAPPHASSTVSPMPTASPWPTHRPLSLSRRTSRSPAPPAQPVSAHDVDEQQKKNKLAAAAPSPKQRQHKQSASGGHSCCLRVYVLHDVPLREARVRRCHEAVQQFTQGSNSPATPTIPRPDHNALPLQHRSRTKEDVHCDHQTPSADYDDVPPVCFVARCEDADVCVTHEVTLRESVLVAIALGCWVVQPGFLECVAAVLEGSSRSRSIRSRQRDDGSASTDLRKLHLLPHPHARAAAPHAAPAATVMCYSRLCEMCATYEWTSATAAATSPALSSPMYRCLVLQCRRRRQAAQARLLCRREHSGGTVAAAAAAARLAGGAGGLANMFEDTSFLFFCAASSEFEGTAEAQASAAKGGSERLGALCRLLRAGGGTVLSVVQVGVSQNVTQCGQLPPTSASSSSASGLLRCCCTSSRLCRAMRTRTDAAMRVEVAAADLYHDLLLTLCDAVYRQGSRDSEAAVALSCPPHTKSPPPYHEGGSSHCVQQHRREESEDESLIVLLDASLLHTTGAGKIGEEQCCVVLTQQDGALAAAEGRLAKSQQPQQSRSAEADAREGSSHNGQSEESSLRKNTTAPATPIVSCSFEAWLASWLACSNNSGAATEEGSYYSSAAQHAMRSHLSACCSLVYHLHKINSTSKPATALSYEEEEEGKELPTTSSLSAVAEARWSYTTHDISFDVPTLEEVLRAYHRDGEGGSTCSSRVAAVARVWQGKASSARRVQFRCASWVGACVAAGGSSVMAAAAAAVTATADATPRDSFHAQDGDAWMRECDALTLLAVLPYL